ncbi:MAG TPA: hypothetical protein VEZ11_10920 [Thermoanaerobaculia bacterium]|nr:hypothetical protein [Thermoanaerobaculia bacterium]
MTEPNPEQGAKKLADSLREWGFDVATFEARAKESLANAKGDLTEVKGAIQKTLAATKERLIDIEKVGAPFAAEIKTGFERAWDEIEQAFHRAKEKSREARRGGPPDAPSDPPQLTAGPSDEHPRD